MSDLLKSACYGKDAFESHELAAKVAGKKKRKGGRVQAYRCGYCDYWHVGGTLRRRKTRR